MPVLSKEIDPFPEYLADGVPRPATSHCTWRVIHTLPRQDKIRSRQLVAREVPLYFPLLPSSLRSLGKQVNPIYRFFPVLSLLWLARSSAFRPQAICRAG